MKVEVRDQTNSVRFIVKDDERSIAVADFTVKRRELSKPFELPESLDAEARAFVESVIAFYNEAELLRKRSNIRGFPGIAREVVEFCASESATEHERALIYQILASAYNNIKKIQREKALKIQP